MKYILLLLVASRIFFLVMALLASLVIPMREGYLGNQHFPQEPYIVWIWANFDGRHFADIVVSGYRNFNFAFFPLYPILIYLAHEVLNISALYVGITISLLSLLMALVVVYKIILIDYSDDIARLSVLLLSFFPLAFFYQAVYTDSLFLFLATTSFYFARRKKWLLAGVFGGFSTLTRLSGMALIPALALEWYIQQNKKTFDWKRVLVPFLKTGFISLLLVSSGFMIYLIYLQLFYGDFLIFQKSMIAWQQNAIVFPPQVIFRYLKIFLTVNRDQLVYWVAVFEFVSMVLFMALSFFVWKKVRPSYGMFMFVLLLIPTFTGTFAGVPRYMLHLFPGFIGMALLVRRYPRLQVPVILSFLVLGFLLTGLFTRGYFIA